MVVAAAQQQQASIPSTTASEEALKRNTDCVYFLASPLTCKKGSECEYRHSEYARVNPRDCYYWLNGNCLNPKCAFRHPPLDGLLGTQTAVSTGSSFPSLHSAPAPAPAPAHAPATHASNNSGKQAVPCIFFQKGLCLKGDSCAFLHGPVTTVNKAPWPTAAAPTLMTTSIVLQKCSQEQKVRPANVPKAVVVPPEAKNPTHKAETFLPRNAVGNERNALPPPLSTDAEFPRYKAANIPPVVNGNSLSRSNPLHQTYALDDQSFQLGKDTDEFLRESSPGFDVLVDDEIRVSDYYHDEDQYGRTTRGHEGRDLNSVNEYDIRRSVDYNSTDMDRETFRDPRGYESYDHMQGQHAWEQHRASSDRVLVGGSSHQESRSYSKAETQNHIDDSDLRYRLSKHRRVNGLRSIVSPDFGPDNQVGEQSHRGSSRRDSHYLSSQESSLSSRLCGRIKLPRRSPVSGSDLRSERGLDRGRNWGSVSPGRPQTSHRGRLHDRIKGRVEDDNGGGNFRGPRMRREIVDDRNAAGFTGPKSLSELKGGKNAESKEQPSLGKRKSLDDHHQPEGGLSFDSPMPLSEILKRKRQAGTGTAASTGISSVYMEDNNQGLVEVSSNTAAQSAVSTVSKEVAESLEANAVKEIEGKNEVTHDQPSQLLNASELEAEDGMIGEEGMEDYDLEADDQGDGESEYEQGDEGDYTYEGGENAEAEEEYLDNEDGDDFTKKIEVMFS